MIYKLFKKGETIADSELVSLVDQLFATDMDYAARMRERVTYRNVLYYVGEQWVEFMQSSGMFRRKILPKRIPTPVSNQVRQFVRSSRAMFMAQNLVPTVRPNTNEHADIVAARLGEKLLVWMDTINDDEIVDEIEKVCDWCSLAGTAFMRTIPEMDGGKWFIDKNGTVIKTGEVVARNVIPFNIVCDNAGEKLNDKRWVGIKSLVAREWVEDTFEMTITQEDSSIRSIDYQRKLMKLVSQVSLWKGHGFDTSAVDDKDRDLVVFKEVEIKPSVKYPNGKYIVTCAGQKVLDVDRMPIKAEKGTWYYSITDFHFNRIPGSFWSDAGVNDIISPQDRINQIDQAFEMNRKGLGRPRVVTPGDVGFKRVSEGGQGFLVISYDPLMAGAHTPKVEHGTPLPEQILKERDNAMIQIQDSSGDPKNILRGKAPTAKASGIMVDILRETAERGHVPDRDRFNRRKSLVYKKRLLLVKEVYTEKRMIKVAGGDETIGVIPFTGADLRNNTDVRMELDSGLSTTMAGQRQILLDLAQYQVLEMQDPIVRQEYLKRLGLKGFAERMDVDINRAEMENSKIATGDIGSIFLVDEEDSESVQMDDALFKYDNHQIHYETHRKFILSEEFAQFEEHLQVVLIHHTDIHFQLWQEELQKQKEEMAAMQEAGVKQE